MKPKVITRPAVVCVNSFAGRREYPCMVIAETPKRYRITSAIPLALPPGLKLMMPGQSALVPKTAVRFTDEPLT